MHQSTVPFPPDMSPDEAARAAASQLPLLRGNRAAALATCLDLYYAGRFQAAVDILVPFLRYNPTAASAGATSTLYGRWAHTLMPEGLEPLLLRWHDWSQRGSSPDPEVAVNHRRAGYLIQAALVAGESLTGGTAPEPIAAWMRIANILGATGDEVMPRELWIPALELVKHIGSARIRNPNAIPSYCLGKQQQRKGRYNALGF
jgi:hypothetical protein